jgi:hypothetical protein
MTTPGPGLADAPEVRDAETDEAGRAPAAEPSMEPSEPLPSVAPPPRPPSAGVARSVPWERLRRGALAVAVAAATALFLWQVGQHYSIRDWLFWRYLKYWAYTAFWGLACASSGHAILRRTLRSTLPLREHLVLAFAVGVVAFFLGMFLCGLVGLYHPLLFFALPVALLAAGAVPSWRTGRRAVRHLRAARAHAAATPWWVWPLYALGLLGVGMIYFSILSPENASFDSRWYHLPIAEHYVAQGSVRRFAEGWYVGASPHLASFLYTWAFLQPLSTLFDRVALSAHLELATFLVTLAGIPSLVRLLVPQTRARMAWVARFLFPGFFLYDSSLVVGADHVAALFAVPIFALTVRWWRDLDPRKALLLAVALSGAFMTKYTGALILIIGPVMAITLRTVLACAAQWVPRWRARWGAGGWRRVWTSAACLLGAGLLLTAPHWLKNWIWHGDPFYPVLHTLFRPRPWTVDSADRFVYGFLEAELWKPTRDWEGVKQTLKALFTFSFVPNDWPKFHGKVPLFGSLFTLALLALPFARARLRLWLLFAATHAGIFVWYWTHHQDRYLQSVVPWMTAAVAAVLLLLWRSGWVVRTGVVLLVAAQAVWGGDAYFIAGHAMIKSPWKTSGDLIATGYKKDFKARERIFSSFADAGASLPPRSKVLVHDYRMHLGLGAMSVSDLPVNQGGISYGRLPTPRAVWDKLRALGVTHVLWTSRASSATDSLAGDLTFFDFALHWAQDPKTFGNLTMARMPSEPPPDERADDLVGVFGCKGAFARGVYHLGQLNVPVRGPRRSYPPPVRKADTGKAISPELVADAAFLVVDPKCTDAVSGALRERFVLAAKRKGGAELWLRKTGVTVAPGEAPTTPDPLDDFGPQGGDPE